MILKLLGAPITAPVAGFRFILQQIADMAERELYDEERIREELLLLQQRLEDGETTEEEYTAQEADIIARLRAARERREALGRR
ncbi:MAG: gas vesicle protein GvpG [Chloroflexi bacterium]|nr:gas vesicle protein GvpG [Chloroflexota bacterium]